MNIPVLLEPIPTGFRASTGGPLNLAAEAPTSDEALAEIRRGYLAKQIAGVRVVALSLPEPDPLIALTRRLASNPEILDRVDAAIKENRRIQEAEDAAAELAFNLAAELDSEEAKSAK